ncbi:hypothetical protein [Desulfonatronospira sp. MSAO_Bac3]|uniref:class I SAM-dependent methyltransferase n=1 Tax=Desulfonatronospira sp. MSAO_Bac3 TaxID=2293857 RepID=UPI000FF81DC1|nr:hypothetical protein [Desulfonatronospira sp. MSAO_Bac3]RQD74845.1 MAG: hypothetical protein D5S03_09490 [Desulfonatronospira sp. MSAO_Bac3]
MNNQPMSTEAAYAFGTAKLSFDKIFLNFIKRLETIGSAWPFFARAYYRLFYKKMLQSEIKASGIKPGMKVMHVGCGPLPMTAMGLAGFGARVTAVDQDAGTLGWAERALEKSGTKNKVSLASGCGTTLDFTGFDAVWLSLHVRPMGPVLNRVMEHVSPGSRIVFRDPRDYLCSYYPGADNFSDKCGCKSLRVKQMLGKKSVVLIKEMPAEKNTQELEKRT